MNEDGVCEHRGEEVAVVKQEVAWLSEDQVKFILTTCIALEKGRMKVSCSKTV